MLGFNGKAPKRPVSGHMFEDAQALLQGLKFTIEYLGQLVKLGE